MDGGFEAEEELKQRQGAALYPLGRALRATFDADNHDTLGSEVTGLMLELTRVPFEADLPCLRDAASPPGAGPAPSRGMLGRIRDLLHRG